MREIFTSGSVGRAPGNRCLYPEADSARAVHLYAARCAPFIAHKWPTHALRLTQALAEKRKRKFDERIRILERN